MEQYIAVWTIITGLIATFVVGFLTRRSWADHYKVVTAGAVSIVLAFARLWLFDKPTWSWDNLWPIALAVFAFAKIWCTAIAWKVPGLRAWWERHGLKDPAPPVG
jgi:hypothetical protein